MGGAGRNTNRLAQREAFSGIAPMFDANQQ